ncbi:unnamed protein product [Lactuca virosa]|uniref:Uncharacterized protein n=1 Tax=Lactuca virosa TaxID=75947 RepID=A0AAU9MZV3_9ASTR|nr:unnamed protein product [Lactuca virosa]
MEKSISRTWVGDLLRGEGESKEVEAVFHQIWFEKHKGLVLICRFNLVSLVLVQVPNTSHVMGDWKRHHICIRWMGKGDSSD